MPGTDCDKNSIIKQKNILKNKRGTAGHLRGFPNTESTVKNWFLTWEIEVLLQFNRTKKKKGTKRACSHFAAAKWNSND